MTTRTLTLAEAQQLVVDLQRKEAIQQRNLDQTREKLRKVKHRINQLTRKEAANGQGIKDR